MSALANLILQNYAATNVTFNPVHVTKDGVARWQDRSGGIPALFPEVSLALYAPPMIKPSMKGSQIDALAYKGVMKTIFPIADVISGSDMGIPPAPSQAYQCTASTTFTLPVRAALAARRDMFAYHKTFLANAIATALIEGPEGVY